jgi:hypothetical protein
MEVVLPRPPPAAPALELAGKGFYDYAPKAE